MIKRLIFLFLIFFLLITIGYFYVNKVFLPIKVRSFITKTVQTHIKRNITIGHIAYSPVKGIIINDVKIFQKNDPSRPLLEVDQIRFNIILVSFLKDKKIIIPSVYIINPYLLAIREEDKSWNFTDIVERRPKKSEDPHDIAVAKVIIKNGEVDYEDYSFEEDFYEYLRDINFGAELSFKKEIEYHLDAKLPKQNISFVTDGAYNLTTKAITSKLKLTNVYLPRYLPFLNSIEDSMIKSGNLREADLNLSWKTEELHIKGAITLEDAYVQDKENNEFRGDLRLVETDLKITKGIFLGKSKVNIPNLNSHLSDGKQIRGTASFDLTKLVIAPQKTTIEGSGTIEDAVLNISPDIIIKGTLHSPILNFTKQDEDITLTGALVLPESNILMPPQKQFKGPLKFENLKVESKDNTLLIESMLSSENINLNLGDEKYILGEIPSSKIKITHDNKKWNISSEGNLDKIHIKLLEGKHFYGAPQYNVAVVVDNNAPAASAEYTGEIKVNNARFTGIPKITEASNIQGRFQFDSTKLKTDELNFDALGARISLKGSIENFQNPLIDIDASSDKISLNKISALSPKLLEKIRLTFGGDASAIFSYKGPMNTPDLAEIQATADLQSAQITIGALTHPLEKVSGKLNYQKDLVTWKDLNLTYDNLPVTVNGNLNNFTRPVIETSLTTDNLSLSTQIKILRGLIRFLKLKGKYYHSPFDLLGEVRFQGEDPPIFDLNGGTNLELSDLLLFPIGLQDELLKLNLKGKVNLNGTFLGYPKDWRNWSVNVTGQSPLLSFMKYRFEDTVLQYEQENKHITHLDITSDFYQGNLSFISSANLTEKRIPFQGILDIEKLDLKTFREAKNIKIKDLSGKLTTKLDLVGSFQDFKNLTGRGHLSVNEGNLWQWKVLEGLFSALLIPELQDVNFTEASADYFIEKQKFHTQNAQLISQPVKLKARGSIDFKGNIDMDVVPKFSEITIMQSESMKKAPTSLISQAVNIKVTGNVKKPEYKVDSSAIKVLEKTTDVIKEGVQGILDGIF